jgi:hypothetical protein
MIDLLALHLPKTGGSSFFETLKELYGEDVVKRYNRAQYQKVIDSGLTLIEDIDEKVKVLQGHLYYKEVKEIVKRDNPKIIVWFRDPVKRVISNYKWWHHSVNTKPNHPERYRKDEKLELYITRKETQNKMYKFLKGFKLKDFYFIGLLEKYDEDLNVLAQKLNWNYIPEHHEKNSGKYYKTDFEVDSELIEKIKKFNKKDIKLYQKVLEFKKSSF